MQPGLIFAGTEFGVFFTLDGGGQWIQLKGGMPVIAVREVEIQRRESDLVLGTMGRGFFILDDYSPLRSITRAELEKDTLLFQAKDTWMYIPEFRYGIPGKAMQGDSFYTAPNPPFGAVFTYYLEEGVKSKSKTRREAEIEIEKQDGDTPYPSWDALRAEDREDDPAVYFVVRDGSGNVVRQVAGDTVDQAVFTQIDSAHTQGGVLANFGGKQLFVRHLQHFQRRQDGVIVKV